MVRRVPVKAGRCWLCVSYERSGQMVNWLHCLWLLVEPIGIELTTFAVRLQRLKRQPVRQNEGQPPRIDPPIRVGATDEQILKSCGLTTAGVLPNRYPN